MVKTRETPLASDAVKNEPELFAGVRVRLLEAGPETRPTGEFSRGPTVAILGAAVEVS